MSEIVITPEDVELEEEVFQVIPVAPVEVPQKSLKKLAVQGSVWTLIGFGCANILRLASNLILTRLLVPEAFGLMALVFALVTGLNMFSDVGIGTSIVQSKHGDDRTFLNSAWTIQVLRGLWLWLGACILAWPIARMYGEPLLIRLMPIVGLTGAIQGFNSTSLFRWERHLLFKRITLIDLASQVISLVIMTVWAWKYPTVWALVGGSVIGLFVKMILTHVCSNYEPDRFGWDPGARKSLFRFGRWILLSTILTFLAMQTDRLILAKLTAFAVVGVYTVAANLGGLPTTAILRLGTVAFPTYSRVHQAGGDLAAVFHKVRRPMILAGGLAIAGMIAGGDLIIRVLYDSRYLEAGWMLRVIAAAAWFQVLECSNGSALLATGRADIYAAGNGAKVLGMLTLAVAGFHFFGIAGAIVGMALSDVVKYFVTAIGTARQGLNGLASDAGFTAFLAMSAFVGVFAGHTLRPIHFGSIIHIRKLQIDPTDLVELAVMFVVTSAIWTAISAFLYREMLTSRISLMLGRWMPQPAMGK